MQRERGRVIGIELKATSASERIISGYASRWDEVDSYGDRVMRGAFRKTLREKMPLMLWQHSALEPCGRLGRAARRQQGPLRRRSVGGHEPRARRIRTLQDRRDQGLVDRLRGEGLEAKQDGRARSACGRSVGDRPVSFAACPHAEVDSVKMQNRLEAAVDRLCKALGGLRAPAAPTQTLPLSRRWPGAWQ